MLRSPLAWFTLIGIAAGLAIGLFVALTTPTPTTVELASTARQFLQERRTRTQWNLTKIPREDDPTTFDYEVTQSQFTYTVSEPAGGVQAKDIPIWQEIIGKDIAAGEFADALNFLSGIRDGAERSDALLFVVSEISNKPLPFYPNEQFFYPGPPAPDFAPAGDASDPDESLSDEERAAKLQNQLREFVQETSQEVDAALEIVKTIDDHGSRAKILMKISSIQHALGNSEIAKETAHTAKAAFADYDAGRHGVWAKVKHGFVTVVGWAGAMGLGTFFTTLFIKVFGYYFIETAAYKIGDKEFARALGTTLKTTAKESGLILPENLRYDVND